MKRYRLLGFDFDTRARFLEPVGEDWAEEAKAAHLRAQEGIIQELREEFGERNFAQKLQNFKDLGAKPFFSDCVSQHVLRAGPSSFRWRAVVPRPNWSHCFRRARPQPSCLGTA